MIYREEGCIVAVDIVEQKSDEKGESFTLKVTETIRPAPNIKPEYQLKVGDVFTVWRAHDAGAYAGWYLSESL